MTDVVIALVQKDLTFAFMQQANGVWRFPAGKVEVGEDFRAAVHRKLDDLSGLKVDTPIRLGMRESEHGTLHYYLCDWQEGELEAVTRTNSVRRCGCRRSEFCQGWKGAYL